MITKAKKLIDEFLAFEAAGGIALGVAAILALVVKNSPFSEAYESFLNIPVHFIFGDFSIQKPLFLWVNDGLMAIFFLLVGLEIKREILEGQLSTREQISLPAFAATGGLLVPALIYVAINWGNPSAMRGWAIPAATDIAFALCVLQLLGKRVPTSLKVCLLAMAILDDLAAIIIIALFYTSNLSLFSLGVSLIGFTILFLFNKRNVQSLGPYMVVGAFLWACILKSGIHATLAGVALAFFIPLRPGSDQNKKEDYKPPLHTLEHNLHSWVAFFILPLFAFANAGVSLAGLTFDMILEPITLGIILGLFLGKQIGVMAFTYIGEKLGICKIPKDVCWTQFYGMALVTGIGFTMSLFIGTLAFTDPDILRAVRLGVLGGSLASGLLGYTALYIIGNKRLSEKTSPK